MDSQVSKKVSFYVLIGTVIVFAVLAYQLMATFFVPMFLAVVLVIVFRPLHERSLKLCKGRNQVAAVLTTAAVLLIVLVPTILVATMAAAEGLAMVGRYDKDAIKSKFRGLRKNLGVENLFLNDLRRLEGTFQALKEQGVGGNPNTRDGNLVVLRERLDRLQELVKKPELGAPEVDPSELNAAVDALRAMPKENEDAYMEALQTATQSFHDYRLALLGGPYQAWLKELANPTDQQLAQTLEQVASTVSSTLLKYTGQTGVALAGIVLGLMIMIMAMFFFFADGPALNRSVLAAIPLDEGYKQELVDEFSRTSRAVVVATLLAAVVQGALAGIGFYFAGLDSVFLMTMLAMVMALVPFIGATSVWLPACLYLAFIEEKTVAAVALFIYCAIVVSTADNVVKPWVLHGQSKLHPLLALLSVLGGVQALGPIGILVGPMVVVFLQTLLRILQRELKTTEKLPAESG